MCVSSIIADADFEMLLSTTFAFTTLHIKLLLLLFIITLISFEASRIYEFSSVFRSIGDPRPSRAAQEDPSFFSSSLWFLSFLFLVPPDTSLSAVSICRSAMNTHEIMLRRVRIGSTDRLGWDSLD